MAIMKSGPGKRAKTTTNKATVKGAVNMVKNLFSTGSKNLGKAKGPGGLAGVASNKGGVRTLTSAKVTGSKKAGIESLKAKRKSGEMTRKEANTKIKNLRDVGVKAKAPGFQYLPQSEMFRGERVPTERKMAIGTFQKQMKSTKLPSDSASYFNKMSQINPSVGRAYQKDISAYQKQVKTLFPNATFEYKQISDGRPAVTVKYNTPLNQMNEKQKAAYKHINKNKQ
jgi:hypothetical protein